LGNVSIANSNDMGSVHKKYCGDSTLEKMTAAKQHVRYRFERPPDGAIPPIETIAKRKPATKRGAV